MFKFVLTQMTHSYAQPCNKSNTFMTIPIKNITINFYKWSYKFQDTILKSTKLFEFQRLGSKLFHSIIAERKKEFLKMLCLILKWNVINVSCSICMTFSYQFKKILRTFCFCKFCKTFLVFCTNVVTEVILNPILGKVFPQRYLVLHQLCPSRHYTEQIPLYGERTYYKLDDKECCHNQGRV